MTMHSLMIGGGGVQGQQEYTTAGTYTWIAPAGVTKICVVCVGGGASYGYGTGGYGYCGGGGGGLGWKNNIKVVPGQSYSIVVGHSGVFSGSHWGGEDSYFGDGTLVKGGGGLANKVGGYNRGTYVGDGGGNGGDGGDDYYDYGGGGGAGGYTGSGGVGAGDGYYLPYANDYYVGGNGTGGAGGGGGSGSGTAWAGGGGGVGIYGQGANGVGGDGRTQAGAGGTGGSGGTNGTSSTNGYSYCWGGNFGGGTGGYNDSDANDYGHGAVRIIWGSGRSFPSTRTGNV